MSYEVSYLPQAEQDLIDILAYGIENWGEQLAESMYLKITDQLETLYFSPNRTKKKGSLGTREMLIVDSPYRAIIHIDEIRFPIFSESIIIDGIAVILRSYIYSSGSEITHWMVAPAMAKKHLAGLAAKRQSQNLMSETDAQ